MVYIVPYYNNNESINAHKLLNYVCSFIHIFLPLFPLLLILSHPLFLPTFLPFSLSSLPPSLPLYRFLPPSLARCLRTILWMQRPRQRQSSSSRYSRGLSER